ncbi:MAG TPA: NAD(P)/FAD-dependent oxidoreductase [Pyrinomonadaceae bacterium]|nr:NAD(P)/FAD-dependent oxidoreductase [Pyrinomonadaceae bacterium]
MASAQQDVIIIGGGHNGLVAACYLARAGLKPLVLERREAVGGCAVTEEFYKGFRSSILAHGCAPLLPHIFEELQLARHGLTFIQPRVRALALNAAAPALTIYDDTERTVQELEKVSAHDARAYPEFRESFRRIGRLLAPLLLMTPPSVDKPTAGELWSLGKLGLKFRGLDKKDAYRLLRYGPMAVADLAAEWFETETLRAVVAARGIFGALAGPWSAGTSAPLLLQAAMDGHAIAPASFVKGGAGALAAALAQAAISFGAEIRTGADVASVRVVDGKATAVVLESGEEIQARAVVSNADPRRTFLKLVDPTDLDPNFLMKVRGYRSLGAAAKVNLALDRLPSFNGMETPEQLSGRIHVGPSIDYLEHAFDDAKYGDYSKRPYMDITIPTLTDPALAPEGKHVMSIYVQFAPYNLKAGTWDEQREEFGDAVIDALAEYATDLREVVLHKQVITPLDLEQTYSLTGGHILHGEPSLDQFFTFRPVIGYSQYRTPIKGLYLCGAGTHPGGGLTGAPGANASREILKEFKQGRRH